MFKKKKRVSESFDAGKANMETPNYEIKINGQVPIDYATAINDRQKRIDKIEKDFEKKDKLTDEFIDDNHDRFEERDKMKLKESTETKLYRRADKIANDIEEIINDISKINWEDFMTQDDFDTLNKAIEALQGFSTAYSYVMDNEDIFESKEEVCTECGKNPCECEELNECNDKETLEEAGRVTPELKKPRASIKKEDKLYSRDDVWARVYDELSSEVENEGPSGEVYKQVKIPRGKRFVGPYTGPGDDDLTVYATSKDDLKWAKKIADHFGLEIVMKEDKNKYTNKYYPYYAILKNVSDAKVTDEEMKDYIDED